MLTLDSPRWAELEQAYGSAEDIPRLIAALSGTTDEGARAEVWFALWRMLWRPDAIWNGAYAAVPHLLPIVETYELGERVQAIHFAMRVELLRRGPTAPAMPPDLVAPYAAAIESLPLAVLHCADQPWSPEIAQLLAAALLVGKRHPALAAELLALGEE